MAPALAGLVALVGVVAGFVALIGIPVLIGVMAYDALRTRVGASAVAVEGVPGASLDSHGATLRIAVERGVARAFVIAGGAFWALASFAGLYSYQETGATSAFMASLVPLVAVAVTLIVGWYYERVVAALLLAASVAAVAWGVVYQFEMGVWALMVLALIGPMLTAALLFWLARSEQEAYERMTETSPELALVFAARSSITR